MGEFMNKTVGKTKKAVGRATNDRDLESEGRMQETGGKIQGGVKKAGRKVRKVEDAIDKVGRKLNDRRAGARPEPRKRKTDSDIFERA